MPTPIRAAPAAFAALALSVPALADGRGPADLLQREAAYYRAYVDADVAAFSDIFADGFTYQHPSGRTFDADGFLDLFRGGTLVVTRADTPDSRVLDYGDTAVTHGESAVEAEVGGQPAVGVIRFGNVWRREGGGWRLVHRNAEFLP